MRTPTTLVAVALALGAAACAPDVLPGTYLCGPEQSCPEGQACNGPDAVCVLASSAEPFVCPDDVSEAEPNDALADGQLLTGGTPACVTPTIEVVGCALGADGEDWFRIVSAADCTAVGVDARLAFAVAFEELDLALYDGAGALVAESGPCPADLPEDALTARCLAATLTPGAPYALKVARTGAGACDGACAFNRYTLTARLETP